MKELVDEFFKQSTIIENDEIKLLLKKYLIGEIDQDFFKSSFKSACEIAVEEQEKHENED